MKYFAVIMIVAQVAFLAWMIPWMVRSHRRSKAVFAEIEQNWTNTCASMDRSVAVLKRIGDPTPMSAVEAEALLSVLQHGTRIFDVPKLEIPKTNLPMPQFMKFKLPDAPKNTKNTLH